MTFLANQSAMAYGFLTKYWPPFISSLLRVRKLHEIRLIILMASLYAGLFSPKGGSNPATCQFGPVPRGFVGSIL